MNTMKLSPVSELMPQIEGVLNCVLAQIAALLPDAELHHIGATAIPGAVTKGDVDVLVRVTESRFIPAIGELRKHFSVKQPENWTAEFASFGDDSSHPLPVGIQVVIKNASVDFFLFLRDYLITNRDVLEQYNQIKMTHASQGAEGYWKAKDAFFEAILALKVYDNPARNNMI